MNEALKSLLDKVEKTGSWYGIEIKELSQKNNIDDTPLHTVCSWGELEPVRLLVEAGADVNARGDLEATPLFNAVIGENAEVVEFLIKAGADPNIQNADGQLVLEYAINVSCPKNVIDAMKNVSKKK